jgi:hypothetical protein
MSDHTLLLACAFHAILVHPSLLSNSYRRKAPTERLRPGLIRGEKLHNRQLLTGAVTSVRRSRGAVFGAIDKISATCSCPAWNFNADGGVSFQSAHSCAETG